MAANTDLGINIATTLDATGLNKADSAVKRFDKTVSKLGRNLGLTLGTAVMVRYGRAAVKAFAADEAAANRLATAVDNLGLSFSQVQVATFIDELERSAAIADDVLRPAFQGLLTTTGSLTKSQELLNNAIQISRASGVDLATVATDLGKGYVGITRGLIKYNTGLTRAEITTKSFNEILGIMLARSAGAAQAYLDTTSYKMEVLTTATGRAQETIGKGLVDALARVGGGTEASDAAKAIDNIAKATSNVIVALGTGIGLIEKFRKGYTNFLAGGDVDAMLEAPKPSANRSKSPAGTAQRTAQQRAAEATAAKRAKELAALQTKQVKSQKALTDEQKKQNALKKAGSIFDLEQIQIIAALQGKLSKDDETRLKAQFALLNGNARLATALTKEILMSQDATGNLYELFQEIPDARNPFAYLEDYLNGLARKAAAVLSGGATGTAPVTPTNVTPSFVGTPFGQAGSSQEAAAIRQLGTPFGQAGGNGSGFVGTPFGQAPIVVQIDGKAVATALQDSSLSGISSSVNRTYGSFAGR
jgi:hypothetical protein